MEVNAIRCLSCGTIIYSRTRHDYHCCECGKCGIDGGFDYIKIIGNPEDWESKRVSILNELPDEEVKKILYDDWNWHKDRYGRIMPYNETHAKYSVQKVD